MMAESSKSASNLRRFLRVLFVACIIGGFAFHLSRQFDKYLYDPLVDIRTSLLNETTFPDVTLCFPYFYWSLTEFVDSAAPGLKCVANVYEQNLRSLWRLALFNTDSESGLSMAQRVSDRRPAKLSMYGLLVDSACGVQLYDMLTFCRYQGGACTFRNFSAYLDDDRGYCFHLAAQGRAYRGSDAASGLILSLTANGEAVDPNGLNPGYQVFVHARDTWPDVANLDGTTGLRAQWFLDFTHSTLRRVDREKVPCVARSQRRLCRLEAPGGMRCREYWVTEGVHQLVAQQQMLVRRCRCVTLAWPIPEEMSNVSSCYHVPEAAAVHRGLVTVNRQVMVKPLDRSAPNVPLAQLVDLPLLKRRHECYQSTLRAISSTLIPKLKEPCFSDTYKVKKQNFVSLNYEARNQASVKKAIIDKSIAEFKRNLPLINSSNPKSFFVNPSYAALRSNPGYAFGVYGVHQTRINIFSQSPTIKNEQYVVYTVLYFLADAGGVTGLWIGMSIVTIFEMGEWVVKKIRRSCKKK